MSGKMFEIFSEHKKEEFSLLILDLFKEWFWIFNCTGILDLFVFILGFWIYLRGDFGFSIVLGFWIYLIWGPGGFLRQEKRSSFVKV